MSFSENANELQLVINILMRIDEFDKSHTKFKEEILNTDQLDEAIPLPSMSSIAGIAKTALKGAGNMGNFYKNVAKNAVSGIAKAGAKSLRNLPKNAMKALDAADQISTAAKQGFKQGYRGDFENDDFDKYVTDNPPSTVEQQALLNALTQNPLTPRQKSAMQNIKGKLRSGAMSNLNSNTFLPAFQKMQSGQQPDLDMDDLITLYDTLSGSN